MKIQWVMLFLSLCSGFAPQAAGGIITVCASGHGDFTLIQKAIDAAVDGDEIIVCDGVYRGPGNQNISFLGKSITVRSENGAAACIVDCEQTARGFVFLNGEDSSAVLRGFTLLNGKADNGGGVLCQSSAPTIEDCRFERCSAPLGGGLYVAQSNLKISRCVFDRNDSGLTGEGYGAGMYSLDAEVELESCQFTNNGFPQDGGGAFVQGGALTATDCMFSGNSVDDGGGGLFIRDAGLTMRNCDFADNFAWYGGGLGGWTNRPVFLKNTEFSRNAAQYGGGVNVVGTLVNLMQCDFLLNRAYSDSAGVLVQADQLVIRGCNFDHNQADYCGSICFSGRNVSIRDTTFINFTGSVELRSQEAEVSRCNFRSARGLLLNSTDSTVRQCTFKNSGGNEGYGGAIEVYGVALIESCTLIGNLALGWSGGAVTIWGTCTIDRCVMLNNSADNFGGAIFHSGNTLILSNSLLAGNDTAFETGGALHNEACASIINCTVVDNHSSYEGGGIYHSSGACQLNVENSILWGNSDKINGDGELAQIAGDENVAVAYSIIQGCSSFCSDQSQHNSENDPQFADLDGADNNRSTVEDNDYRPRALSPLVDAGNNRAVPSSATTDLDGADRFVDDHAVRDRGKGRSPVVDVGAYEYVVPACTGGEQIDRVKCKDRNGSILLIVRMEGGAPGDTYLIKLAGGARRNGIVLPDGAARERFHSPGQSAGTVSVTWGCGATSDVPYECP
ncbi:MAG: hypothetical protein BroJett003_03530 [Planctomycetota bacterium]|nr:MAG: hypothetical protein BroJett003_03530 [Planctomycetota bacterium]